MTSAVVIGVFVLVATVPAAAAFRWAASLRGWLAIVAVGVAIAAVLLALGYLGAAKTSEPRDCSDCGEFLGRWLEPGFVLVVYGFALVLWIAGSLAGYGARRLRRDVQSAKL